MVATKSSERGWTKLIGGVLVGIIVSVAGFLLTRPGSPLNPKNVAMNGEITAAEYSSGNEFSVRVALKGFNGQECLLSWSIYDADTASPVRGFTDQPAVGFIPESDDDSARENVTIQVPPVPGTYFVRFVLTDPDGVELDRKDTEWFEL